MTVSPGSSSARYAAMLAFAPECGCTLAWSAPNSAHRALARELFGLVDDEVAAVVALGRIPLGVLVGEDRALRREHGGRREVLRGDQLDRRVLALQLAPDDVSDRGVGGLEGVAGVALHRGSSLSGITRSVGVASSTPAKVVAQATGRGQRLEPAQPDEAIEVLGAPGRGSRTVRGAPPHPGAHPRRLRDLRDVAAASSSRLGTHGPSPRCSRPAAAPSRARDPGRRRASSPRRTRPWSRAGRPWPRRARGPRCRCCDERVRGPRDRR